MKDWRDPSYPDSIKARAVALKREGSRNTAIRSMILAECQRAPLEVNMTHTLRRWAVRYPDDSHQGQMSG